MKAPADVMRKLKEEGPEDMELGSDAKAIKERQLQTVTGHL